MMMKKKSLHALVLGVIAVLFAACGEQAKLTDTQKGKVSLATSEDLSCKGPAFQGNDFLKEGSWAEADFVSFTPAGGPIKVKRSGLNYCRNETGRAVTLTSGNKTFTTSDDAFYFEILPDGKIAGDGVIDVARVSGGYSVQITTSARAELLIKEATLDGTKLSFVVSNVLNHAHAVTLESVKPGILKIRACFNTTNPDCEPVLVNGRMAKELGLYLKALQTEHAPYLVSSFIEEDSVQRLAAEMLPDGSFAAPSKVVSITWEAGNGGGNGGGNDPDTLDVVDGLYGSHARGKGIVHTGASWSDLADWGQSQFAFWCRMQVNGSCGFSPSLVNDGSRTSGTWASATLPGTFGDSADDRQFRRSISLTSGTRYSIKYCVRHGSGGSMYMDVVSTNAAGDQLQVSIYDLALPANTTQCDSFTFEATSTGTFYLAAHTGLLTSGDFRMDDFSVTVAP